MSTLVRNVSLLHGEEFQLIHSGSIQIDHGEITRIEASTMRTDSTNVREHGADLLAIPGMINSHIHLGDAIAKDTGIGSSLNELVHPIHGLKTKLLHDAKDDQICDAIAATSCEMIASGITTFADFREGGLLGVQLALKALEASRQRRIILGRPNHHFNEKEVAEETSLSTRTLNELVETLDLCAGVGISGPNEYTNNAMTQISELTKKRGRLLASHAAESAESKKFSLNTFKATEVERAIHYLKPDLLVHLTNSTQQDLKEISKESMPIVCCPRANSILGLGFPPILELLRLGVTVALGTDNVMLNPPDMFREMDYTSRMLRSIHRDPAVVNSREILKMATVNAARALRLESEIGSLEEGKRADIVFLDLNSANLRFSKDLVSSVVHRARPEDVRCVMVDGEIVYGSIPNI